MPVITKQEKESGENFVALETGREFEVFRYYTPSKQKALCRQLALYKLMEKKEKHLKVT